MAEAAQAQAIADLAEQDGWSDEDVYVVDGRRPVRLGADGTDLVDEALPLEVAVARGTSVGAATWLVRDVVNLRARHPHTWAAVQQCRLPLWQAARVAQECADHELTREQALAVDERLRPALGRLGLGRLTRLLRAAMMWEAPEAMRRQARPAQEVRYCRRDGDARDPGTSYLTACVDTADAIFFDAAVDRLADILGEEGDPDDKDHRRAKAVGILATPAYALSLLGAPSRRGLPEDETVPTVARQVAESALPTAQVFVHLHANTLATGCGVARVEGLGPVFVTELERIVGHSRIKLTPVAYLGETEHAVDAYEIPERIRNAVILRDRHEIFPWSSREARRLDLDHTEPWVPGRARQTRPSNLGPLSRRAHRVKTHAGWQLAQPEPGVFVWKTGLGQTIRVGPDGTTRIRAG